MLFGIILSSLLNLLPTIVVLILSLISYLVLSLYLGFVPAIIAFLLQPVFVRVFILLRLGSVLLIPRVEQTLRLYVRSLSHSRDRLLYP